MSRSRSNRRDTRIQNPSHQLAPNTHEMTYSPTYAISIVHLIGCRLSTNFGREVGNTFEQCFISVGFLNTRFESSLLMGLTPRTKPGLIGTRARHIITGLYIVLY